MSLMDKGKAGTDKGKETASRDQKLFRKAVWQWRAAWRGAYWRGP